MMHVICTSFDMQINTLNFLKHFLVILLGQDKKAVEPHSMDWGIFYMTCMKVTFDL